MAHTPGPWLVVHELRDTDEAVCDLVNDTWVIKGHHLPLGSWHADARLIAAAPDLLEVARMVVENYEGGGDEQSVAKAARAAMARATGAA